MAPSAGGFSNDRLKRQLEATFGTGGNGTLNIAELQKLLYMFVELHAGHADSRKENRSASELPRSNVQEDSASRTGPSPATAVNVNETADVPLDASDPAGSEASLNVLERRSSVSGRENASGDLSKINQSLSSISPSSTGGGSPAEHRILDENQPMLEDQQDGTVPAAKGNDPIRNAEKAHPSKVTPSSEISSQRSSDFNVKSTSSTAGSSSGRMGGGATSIGSHSGHEAVQNLSDVVPRIDGTECSPLAVDSPIALHKFVAIAEGCKTQLELAGEEILALKNRCQSQHEDTLRLAGGLDHQVERLDEQTPIVAKLEKDTHCLGMLVSDYEQKFASIGIRLERNDLQHREFERTLQRVDRERDAIRAELRTLVEQVNYLCTAKADKLDVQTELGRRALVTDLQLRVPYDVFNDGVRELTRFVTQMRETMHELEENLKTVQYELVRGLGAKASAQDVSQIRKQLVGVIARWQKAEKGLQAATGDGSTQLIRGSFQSAAVAINGPAMSYSTPPSTCLSCGIPTTLEGSKSTVPVAVRFIPSCKSKTHARNAGGLHTKCAPTERVFRTGSLSMVVSVRQC